MQPPEVQNKDYKKPSGDCWEALKTFTAARIALGRTGTSVPLAEALNFRLAHAHARDAVYSALDVSKLTLQLNAFGQTVITVKSKVKNRVEYLQRPDLGRQLSRESKDPLRTIAGFDIAFVVADGLSALAVHAHTLPLLHLLIPLFKKAGFSLAPVIIAEQARVAIGDDIGELLKAQMTIILIGERPGLSSTDSLSAYLTYKPATGKTDEMRNCVSNIHSRGLGYDYAATKISYLVQESLRRKLSGIALKDEMKSIG